MLRIRRVAAGSIFPAVLIIALSLPSSGFAGSDSFSDSIQRLTAQREREKKAAKRIKKCRQALSDEDIENVNNIYEQAAEQEEKGNYQTAIDLYRTVESHLLTLIICRDTRYKDSEPKQISLAAVRRGLGRSYSLSCMNARAVDMFQSIDIFHCGQR